MYPFFRLTVVLVSLLFLACHSLQAADAPPWSALPDTATIRLTVTGVAGAKGRITQPVTFAAPIGQPSDRQVFLIEIWSETPQPVTWDTSVWKAGYGMPLPKTTRGGSTYELWGFRYHAEDGVLRFFATTPLAE